MSEVAGRIAADEVKPAGRALSGFTLPGLALLSGLGLFAVLQLLVVQATGGVFEYPLDDPYIHLALAEQIAHGHYGVNAGEVSSPGSSALFPLLLTPFADSSIQRFLPLLWNVVGLALSAFLWGRLLVESGYGRAGWRWLGITAALIGPIAVMMPQLAFVGMEHSLHMAASLAIVLGLYRYCDGRGGIWLIVAGAVFASSLRFEGLALGLGAAGVLAFGGARRAGLATALASLLPILGFMAFLAMIGLDPLPSSVQSKLAETSGDQMDFLGRQLVKLALALSESGGPLLVGLSFALLVLWRLAPALRNSRWGMFAAAVVFAGFGHLAVGRVGWLNRYEPYIIASLSATLLVLLPRLVGARPGLRGGAMTVGVLAAGLLAYQPFATTFLPTAPLAIHSQQGQMARFVKDYLKTPVAVNDIGEVSWQNPNYVLDLWGLADARARAVRLADPAPGWAGRLTDAHQVPVALIYDNWFGTGVGSNWVKLGQLHLIRRIGFLGGADVSFYATAPDQVAPLRAAICAWQPSIDGISIWQWAPGMEAGE